MSQEDATARNANQGAPHMMELLERWAAVEPERYQINDGDLADLISTTLTPEGREVPWPINALYRRIAESIFARGYYFGEERDESGNSVFSILDSHDIKTRDDGVLDLGYSLAKCSHEKPLVALLTAYLDAVEARQ